MSAYECTFIARHDMSPTDVQKLADKYKTVVSEHGANVKKEEHWGLRSLAYKINKASKGHYVYFGIEGDYAAVAEMERQLRLDEDVIRQLTIRVDQLDMKPTPIMKHKQGEAAEAA